MHADEFVILFLWVLAPPLLLGFVLLRLLAAGAGTSSARRLLPASLLLALLAGLAGVLLVVLAPAWLGRSVGMRDIDVLGITTIWAPFAFVAVALAFPFAAWFLRQGVKR